MFSVIRQGDVLVQHPYESFSESVEEFIIQASRDPQVLAIKQTLYRTSGDSAIVRALIRAAEQGKQVAALVELKARGDEAANIGWARALEEAGVHVVYGLVGLKTHSKTALVVRQEGDGIRRYCHIGTGNYNASTARMYEDIGILTASPELGADLTDLFNYLTGYSRRVEYRKLLVAPATLRTRMLELIEQEAGLGNQGRIIWKLNNLVDRGIIDALYAASSAGVQIDLIVRAICGLRPGVPGLSDNIRVRSIVGRWLEHSRIFYFGAGASDGAAPLGNGEAVEGAGGAGAVGGAGGAGAVGSHRAGAGNGAGEGALTGDGEPGGDGEESDRPDGSLYLVGSADMMERNLDRRVEAVVPVEAPGLRARLREILELDLADDTRAWALHADGSWHKVKTGVGMQAQHALQDLAVNRARRRREAPVLHGAPSE